MLFIHAFFIAVLFTQDPDGMVVTLRGGQPQRIDTITWSEQSVQFRVFMLGGEMTITRKLADFEPESAFRMEVLMAAPRGFDEHFKLARRAAAMGLLTHAGAQARHAIDAAGDGPEGAANVAAVNAWAADTLEDSLAAAVQRRDVVEARQLLKLLTTRLADQRTEAALATLAQSVEALEESLAEDKELARVLARDAKDAEAVQRRLRPILEAIKRGDAQQLAGIAGSRNTAQSSRMCEQSVESYMGAWKAAVALGEAHRGDRELTQKILLMGARLQASAVRSALHAANMLTVQSDYRGAMEWTRRVLAWDPDNAEAREITRTIQVAQAAASSQWGWGWQIVDRDPRRLR